MKRYMRKINLHNATVITKPVFTEKTKDYRKSHPVWHCDKCNAPVVFVESKSTGKKYLSGIKKYRRHGNRYADWKLWVNYYPSFEPHSKSCKGEAMNMPQTETTQEVIQPREEIIMKNENKTGKVYAGSGSRSLKQDPQMFDKVVMRLIEMIETTKPAMLITGMAEGFDEALAIAAMATSTPLKAMIPFKGYCNHYWGLKSVTGRNRLDECKEIIAYAQSTGGVEYICSDWRGPDGRYAMFHRNEAMANACDKAWIWNPSSKGTAQFHKYCVDQNIPHYIIKIDGEGPGDTPQTPSPEGPKEDNMKTYVITYGDGTQEVVVTDKRASELAQDLKDAGKSGVIKPYKEEVMQAPQISHWDSPDDQYYWDSLSQAAQECLSLYQKMDPEFHNDDPYDFINPDEVARHVHNVMTLGWGDFRHLMNQAEVQQYNLLYPNKEEEVVKTPQITNIKASIQEAIEPKEKDMKVPKIFHWLEESDVTNAAGHLVINHFAKDSEMVMVITNNPTPQRRQVYQDALMGGGSAKHNDKLNLWLMPVRTGTWGFHYLERLNDKGVKFTVTIRRLDLMVERYDQRDDTDDRSVGEVLVEQANLAWVDNRNLYLVDIDGVPAGGEFDWSLIGITANDAKKLPKRMAEIVRLAKSGSSDPLRVMVLNPETKTKNPDFWVKAFDGKNAIRFSALPEDMRKSLKKSGHLHIMDRGFTHVDGKKFLVKGDFVVVPDYMWNWQDIDVVAHGENLKTEVTTDEDLWTFWEHAPLHVTTWDQQTMLNYPRILTVKSMRDDYLAEMSGIDAQLAKGLLPGQVESDSQVQAEEEAHDEFKKLVPKPEEIRKNRDLATKIKEAGFDVRMFQNLVYMSLNGFANSKARFMHIPEFDKEGTPNYLNGKHDKHVVTMRNSFRATCVTDTFLKHFVGIPYSTERIAFFDKNVGMVWNGEHFARTFELHGTHDNDDTHFFVPVKLWSDDPKTVAKLKKSGVMLDNLAIPDKAENAKMVLLVLRLPNGAGEYSIMEFDFNTWPKEIPFDESLVKTHNLSFRAGWVKPQPMCIPNNMPGLPTSRVYSKVSYTRADLLTDLKAQYVNPGFGAMCNALVSYSSITHGGIPSCMTDSLGNIVDATQQGADIKSFEAIDNLMDDIKTELAQIGGTIDTYFYYRRGAVAKTGVKAGTVYVRDGEIEEFDSEYKSIYTKLKHDIKDKYSFKMRQSVRINQEITRMTFNAELIAWCKKFILNMEENLSANDKMDTGMVPSKFTKPVHQAILRERRHSVVDAAIAQLEALPNTDEVMLCMWYTILTPKLMGPHATHGSSDRAICQMGSERALAHLLIDAIVNRQEKRKANVGANKVVFTSNKLVDGAFVNHVVKPLQADRATQMPIDIISDIIGKIPQNFKFVWIMADNKPLAVFRRQNSTFVEVDADLPETINL